MTTETRETSGLRSALITLAAVQAVIGLLQAFAPGWFYEQAANFGPRADHMMRDVATYYLASALALVVAVGRPSWRTPVLFLVLVQYVLHALNHVLDIGDADPSWVGPVDAISLAIGAGLLLWCLRTSQRDDAARVAA